jgi:hypothetical protein
VIRVPVFSDRTADARRISSAVSSSMSAPNEAAECSIDSTTWF